MTFAGVLLLCTHQNALRSKDANYVVVLTEFNEESAGNTRGLVNRNAIPISTIVGP